MVLAVQSRPFRWTCSSLRRIAFLVLARNHGFTKAELDFNISYDSALRLAHFFGTSPDFWLSLQKLYELRLAEEKAGATIRRLPRLATRAKSEGRKTVGRAA